MSPLAKKKKKKSLYSEIVPDFFWPLTKVFKKKALKNTQQEGKEVHLRGNFKQIIGSLMQDSVIAVCLARGLQKALESQPNSN